MQHTLTYEKDGKKYTSKPFDFEAMCIINDSHTKNDDSGYLRHCSGAVDYLFEGTDVTQDVIDKMDIGVRGKMCLTLWKFYIDALSSKNE